MEIPNIREIRPYHEIFQELLEEYYDKGLNYNIVLLTYLDSFNTFTREVSCYKDEKGEQRVIFRDNKTEANKARNREALYKSLEENKKNPILQEQFFNYFRDRLEEKVLLIVRGCGR